MTSGITAKTNEAAMLGESLQASALDSAIARSVEALLSLQHRDGYWVFELEADATIPAEYILLQHYLGTIDTDLEQRIARYLRAVQGPDGGWPLFFGGATDLNATVKAYFALKAVGDPLDAAHMQRARAAILARGGARNCNVFTRIMLALWGEVPWRAVPVMPVEIMLLPRWSLFHVDKVSYWSRTVLVPLLVLMAVRPKHATRAASGSRSCSSSPRRRSATGSRRRPARSSAMVSWRWTGCCAPCSRSFQPPRAGARSARPSAS